MHVWLIPDDMVAQAIKSDGGFVWACKNYDGDVMVSSQRSNVFMVLCPSRRPFSLAELALTPV